MRVLIADRLAPIAAERLRALGLEVLEEPGLGAQGVAERLREQDVGMLIVRSTEVRAEAIAEAAALQLIVRAGAGVNTIDVGEASRRGVFVANCPGKNAVAVAELAIGLIVAADRQIGRADAALKAGRWEKKNFSGGHGLLGKRLGIVGLGQIGRQLVPRAQALGLQVGAWSRSLTQEEAAGLGVERAESIGALAAGSDILSVHLARCPGTLSCVGSEVLAALPPGALLINTSRGGVVDEQAVLEALEGGRLRAYGTDVFDGEPGSGSAAFESPLARHPQVVGTPHIGASTQQAQQAVALEAVRVIEVFLERGKVPNCVNRRLQSSARVQLGVRHLNRVGVLASVLTALREADINVEELENVIFEGAEAAFARVRLDAMPAETLLAAIDALPHVLDASLRELEPSG